GSRGVALSRGVAGRGSGGITRPRCPVTAPSLSELGTFTRCAGVMTFVTVIRVRPDDWGRWR
ncbi:hypothetical protein ACFQZ8_30880, partial [Micromonospora azadirachtae]